MNNAEKLTIIIMLYIQHGLIFEQKKYISLCFQVKLRMIKKKLTITKMLYIYIYYIDTLYLHMLYFIFFNFVLILYVLITSFLYICFTSKKKNLVQS